jgi:hypothetical protein
MTSKRAVCPSQSNLADAYIGQKTNWTHTFKACAKRPLDMGGGQMKTPAHGQVQPGQDNRYANAAGIPKVSQPKRCAKRAGLYQIHPDGGAFAGTYGRYILRAQVVKGGAE